MKTLYMQNYDDYSEKYMELVNKPNKLKIKETFL